MGSRLVRRRADRRRPRPPAAQEARRRTSRSRPCGASATGWAEASLRRRTAPRRTLRSSGRPDLTIPHTLPQAELHHDPPSRARDRRHGGRHAAPGRAARPCVFATLQARSRDRGRPEGAGGRRSTRAWPQSGQTTAGVRPAGPHRVPPGPAPRRHRADDGRPAAGGSSATVPTGCRRRALDPDRAAPAGRPRAAAPAASSGWPTRSRPATGTVVTVVTRHTGSGLADAAGWFLLASLLTLAIGAAVAVVVGRRLGRPVAPGRRRGAPHRRGRAQHPPHAAAGPARRRARRPRPRHQHDGRSRSSAPGRSSSSSSCRSPTTCGRRSRRSAGTPRRSATAPRPTSAGPPP